MGRKIPIYDTSYEDLRSIEMDWDQGLVGSHNLSWYIEKICKTAKCEPSQHLEISRNSNFKMGRKCRTASLFLVKGNKKYSAESIYQGSKVFNSSPNNHNLYEKDGDYSLKIKSTWKGRKVIGINLFGYLMPTSCLTYLHDIAYWIGLEDTHKDVIFKAMEILKRDNVNYFTDSFDSPNKNSQSQSFSKYYLKWKNGLSVWDDLNEEQKYIYDIIKQDKESEKTDSYFDKNGFVCNNLF